MARYYIEPSAKRRKAANYSAVNDAPLSYAFEADFAACARRNQYVMKSVCHERLGETLRLLP